MVWIEIDDRLLNLDRCEKVKKFNPDDYPYTFGIVLDYSNSMEIIDCMSEEEMNEFYEFIISKLDF